MADSAPKANLLRRIANQIFQLYDCTQLAILLGIDHQIVDALKEETRDPHKIAFSILDKWRLKPNATGRKLYCALNQHPFEHLAREFKNDLLETASGRLLIKK